MSDLRYRKCAMDGCENTAYPGEEICDAHLIERWKEIYLKRSGAPFCKHPEACEARAHHPGDPIAPDFRHCEECRG